MSATTPVRCVLKAQSLNGESPVWDAASGRLFWQCLREPALHVFDPRTGQDSAWEMPAAIGAFALTDTGAVVALSTGLFDFTFADGSLRFLAPPPFDPRRFVFNDGGLDRQGRLWIGPMYEPLSPGDASPAPREAPFWRYDGGGRWHAGTRSVKTANGLAFSPDGRTMYYGDTLQKTLWAADYDPALGQPVNERVFARVEEGTGPDGASVDAEGFLWCAIHGAGKVLRFDPQGRVEREVRMPVQYPTMPTFGGDDLRTVYVTSANHTLSPEERRQRPEEGNLFAFEAPVAGLPRPRLDPSRK
ncbi:SMP-30/gluconolactonase/LRE family protein [Melittangium boletus]|uniref:SMP-30/gluconolactonase/LRE family protein n=1 Tax=Melittangium boletus TaxID=83453 RepID=UPI003DA2F5F3